MSDSSPGSDTEHFKRQVVEHEVHIEAINLDRRDMWQTIGEIRRAINGQNSKIAMFQGIGIAINALLIYYFTKH